MYEKLEAICQNCDQHFAVVFKQNEGLDESLVSPSFCPFCSNALILED